MRSIALPARRAFIAAIIIIFLLYAGFAYEAIAVVIIFLISWFLYPAKQPKDFFSGAISALDGLADYLRHVSAGNVTAHAEEALFKSFSGSYPNWVSHSGFNPGLRSGYRHFLIQLERVADLCCSMGYWFAIDEALVESESLMPALRNSLKINIDLLSGLSRTMQHHAEKTLRPVNDTNVDFVSDITALEDVLKSLVPPSLELLDMSQEYVQMTAIVRDVKDLREVLLLLVNAVPV